MPIRNTYGLDQTIVLYSKLKRSNCLNYMCQVEPFTLTIDLFHPIRLFKTRVATTNFRRFLII